IMPALPPDYPWLAQDMPLPQAPDMLHVAGGRLRWHAPAREKAESLSDAVAYVVYRLDSDRATIDDPEHIEAIVRDGETWDIPDDCPPGTWFTVTSLDRVNRESAPAVPIRL
ncbi:MAG: hypothetical protein K2L69_08335, partial [Muribaculaceae bacterium]|nr:hypothetical protein [Muribaculaceae bacterium]